MFSFFQRNCPSLPSIKTLAYGNAALNMVGTATVITLLLAGTNISAPLIFQLGFGLSDFGNIFVPCVRTSRTDQNRYTTRAENLTTMAAGVTFLFGVFRALVGPISNGLSPTALGYYGVSIGASLFGMAATKQSRNFQTQAEEFEPVADSNIQNTP